MRARTRIYLSIFQKEFTSQNIESPDVVSGLYIYRTQTTTRLRLTDLRSTPQLSILIRCIKKSLQINTIICIIIHRKEVKT